MERLTEQIDSHLLDNGKLCKEYSLNSKIELNDYSCMDIPNAVYNKLGELEDVLGKYGIETTEELDGVLKPLIDNGELENWRRVIFWKAQNERLKQELAELKQKAIVPKFNVGDYFIEYWDTEPSIYRYKSNNHFECLNKVQGYHCDYIVLGALLLGENFIKKISKEEAEQKLAEIKGEKLCDK